MMRVAALGLGEAGRLYARDFVEAGVQVLGYDVRRVEAPPGVVMADRIADAVRDADLVLSLTTAAGAVDAAKLAGTCLGPATVYADLNASSPSLKAEVAGVIGSALFADVAVLAPVARRGLRTPLLVAGAGAEAFAKLLAPYEVRLEIVPGQPGAAASRKLLRSIFMKSMAAAVLESLAAARVAGCEAWVRSQIAGELGEAGDALVERLVQGTYDHAERRLHEMKDARDYIEELGSADDVTAATITWLAAVASGQRR